MALPWESGPSAIESRTISLDELKATLSETSAHAYAVLDACDEPRVPQKVAELGSDKAVCLYRGWAERDYGFIAPFLAKLDEALLDWIVENLWDEPWGFVCIAPIDLPPARKHFRRFLQFKGPNGDMLFRFYDPRVLKAFLRSSTTPSATEFFGPVQRYLVAGETDELLEFTPSSQTVPGPGLFPGRSGPGRVTEDQMDAIVEQQTLDFERRLYEHLKEVLPARGVRMTDEELWWHIERALERSRTFPIERECDVARYVELVCGHLAGFTHRHPIPVEDILFDRRKDVPQRLDELTEYLQTQNTGVM